jgi:hypothetical protein
MQSLTLPFNKTVVVVEVVEQMLLRQVVEVEAQQGLMAMVVQVQRTQ